MLRIFKADEKNMEDMLSIRIEMLKEVNHLSEQYEFDEHFMETTRQYFAGAGQSTILACQDEEVIGCATLCYLPMLPTYAHQTGSRAHLMNVYTKPPFRCQGIASTMLYLLIEEAKENGVAEITLDATEHGKGLYRKYGFVPSQECMVLNFGDLLQKSIERYEKYGCQPQGHCGC